ncbi:MAG: DUF4922 domain-containing protein [Bacteroidales bacterium]|nr:DUF4922 domain-containing protein [Bacteroidales bacterium]
MSALTKFISDQLSVWPLAASNFRKLKAAESKTLEVGGLEVKVQFNPSRIASSTCEVDALSIGSRPCFLCVENRPREQFHLKFEGRKGRRYNIQVNPYPVFPDHLVIARDTHVPQSIAHVFVDAMDFSRKYPEFLVFYNGPCSGASAPDHLHFQACHLGQLPLQTAADEFLANPGEPLATNQDARLYEFPRFAKGIYVLDSETPKSLAKLFYRLLDCAPVVDGESEPRFNLFSYCSGKRFRAIVVLRGSLRSHHYASRGDDHLTMSPGAADVAGMFIAPVEEDFRKVDAGMLEEMVREVTIGAEDAEKVKWRLSRKQLKIDVAIMSAPEIRFEVISDGAGPQCVAFRDGRIEYGGVLYDELYFDRVTASTLFAEPSFILYDVPVGEGAVEDERFAGSLKFIVEEGRITAINHVGIENCLLGIISFGKEGKDSPESLKEEAVKVRSWLLGRIGPDRRLDGRDRRYRGLSAFDDPKVKAAIDQTWGEVL